jgi:hypothetical protein
MEEMRRLRGSQAENDGANTFFIETLALRLALREIDSSE